MSDFVRVCKVDDISENGLMSFLVNGEKIVIIRQGKNIFAIEDKCSHEDFPLSEGWLEKDSIYCAYHGAKFDLKTGEALSLPAYEAVKRYPVQIIDGYIELDVKK